MVSLERDVEIYLGKEHNEHVAKRYSRCTVLWTRVLHKSLDPNIYYDMATIFYRKGDYQKAIQKYSFTIVLDPDSHKAYNAWGSCLSHLGRYEEAIVKFKKAIEIDPKYALAYLNWGLILFWQKKSEKAEEIIEEGIRKTEMREEIILNLYQLDMAIVEKRLEDASNAQERNFLIWKIVGYNRTLELIQDTFDKIKSRRRYY